MPVKELKPIKILIIEDEPADAELVIDALKEGKIVNDIVTVETGEEALAYLSNNTNPSIIFLDLNLPDYSGHDLLKKFKDNPKTTSIPVVVMTSSTMPEDVLMSYKGQAACFVSKPLDANQFIESIKQLGSFFFQVVTLP